MSKVLIIDGNNLSFRIWASFVASGASPLTTSVGLPTTTFYGIIRSLETFCKTYTVDKALVAWDVGGGSAYRKSIYPIYKGNRTYTDMDDFFGDVDACRDYFNAIGLNQAPLKGIEADDTIGWMAVQCIKKGHEVIIYSDDKDYYQLMRKGLSIYRPSTEKLMRKKDIMALYGKWENFQPKHLILVDALVGQEKDFIPGACDIDLKKKKLVKFGFGPDKARKLLVAADYDFTKAKEILKGEDCPINDAHRTQILKNWKQVLLSRRLARIRTINKQYSREELAKLKRTRKALFSETPVRARTIVRLIKDLEIKTVDVIAILKGVGVNITGNDRSPMAGIKT